MTSRHQETLEVKDLYHDLISWRKDYSNRLVHMPISLKRRDIAIPLLPENNSPVVIYC